MKNIPTVTESKAFQQLVHEWLHVRAEEIRDKTMIFMLLTSKVSKLNVITADNLRLWLLLTFDLAVYRDNKQIVPNQNFSPSQFQDLDLHCSCRNTSSNPVFVKRHLLASEGTHKSDNFKIQYLTWSQYSKTRVNFLSLCKTSCSLGGKGQFKINIYSQVIHCLHLINKEVATQPHNDPQQVNRTC